MRAWKLTDELPSVLANVVQVDRVTGVGVAVTGGANRAAAQLLSVLIREIPLVSLHVSQGQNCNPTWSRTP